LYFVRGTGKLLYVLIIAYMVSWEDRNTFPTLSP